MKKDQKRPLHVEISLFIHATEDPVKVLRAVKNIFPESYAEDVVYEKSDLSGYHKNPIILLKVIIKEKARAIALLKNIFSRLEAEDKAHLSSNFSSYVDSKGILYMRLDKQGALLEKIRFCSGDSIRIKTKFNFIPQTLEELEYCTLERK